MELLESRVLFTAGQLDTSFNGVGFTVRSLPNGFFEVVAADVQSSGKTILAGTVVDQPGTQKIGVERLNSDGSLDQTFGNGGVAVIGNGRFGDGEAVKVLSDDSIIVGGEAELTATSNLSRWWRTLRRTDRLTRRSEQLALCHSPSRKLEGRSMASPWTAITGFLPSLRRHRILTA